MANQTRKRGNFFTGVVFDNPLTNSATTLNSPQLVALPAVDATEFMPLVLDPTGVQLGPEVVYVTAHTAGTSTATMVRGREGTTGVQHSNTATWIHGPTKADWPNQVTSATRPSGTGLPYQGQQIYETDTEEVLWYNGVNWRPSWRRGWGIYTPYGGHARDAVTHTGLTTTAVEVASALRISTTTPANRTLRITCSILIATASGSPGVIVDIRDVAGTTGYGRVIQANDPFTAQQFFGELIVQPGAASYVFTPWITATGTGTLEVTGATTATLFTVEDIGPNGAAS